MIRRRQDRIAIGCVVATVVASRAWAASGPDPAVFSAPSENAGEGGCVGCHQVQADPRLSRPVREERLGIHFQKGVHCEGCHGGDPAAWDPVAAKRAEAGYVGASGAFGDPSHLCGRCHEGALRVWRESGHNQPSATAAAPRRGVGHQLSASNSVPFPPPGLQPPTSGLMTATCVTCHGSHAVKRASTDLINPRNCAGCHGFPESNTLKTYVLQAVTAVHSTAEQIKRFRAAGGGAFEEQAALEQLWGPVRALPHMTDREQIRRTTIHVREDSARVSGRVKWLEGGFKYRTRVRVVWAVMAAVTAVVGGYYFAVATRMKRMIKR